MISPPPEAVPLKRLAFNAVEVTFGEMGSGIEVFTAAGLLPEHGPIPHVVIMRSFSDPPTSIHLDCHYPLYGGVYGAIERASVSPEGLRLDLRTDLATQLRKLGGLDISWNLPAEEFDRTVAGLRSIFRETDVLNVL